MRDKNKAYIDIKYYSVNSKLILVATSLGTNIVVVTRVHCKIVVVFFPLSQLIAEPGCSISYKIVCMPSEDSKLREDTLNPRLPTECPAKPLIRLRGCAG